MSVLEDVSSSSVRVDWQRMIETWGGAFCRRQAYCRQGQTIVGLRKKGKQLLQQLGIPLLSSL